MKRFFAAVAGGVLLAGFVTVATVAQTPPDLPAVPATLDQATGLWFVEMSSPPTADGTSLKTVRSEKAAFRKAAAQAGLRYQERYAFDTLFNGLSVRASRADVARMSGLTGVKAVWPVVAIDAPEPREENEPDLFTALAMTGADVVQSELGYTGAGVKVAVVDTGIDYDHPDLGGCFGPGCRVAYGYDFVGDAFNADSSAASYNPLPTPDNDPDDCAGHGSHVAGIVGANGVVKGVAPGVTFGAYRVFGCNGSTFGDIMIAAMERALADGMQVLNMSIGSSFQWPQYPTAMAATRLVNKRVVVVASIGNSGANGLYAAGAPGVGEKVIGVASFDNTHVYLPAIAVSERQIGYVTMTFSPPPPTSGTGQVADVGLACSALPPGSLTGKVALAARGSCSFAIKATTAIAAGATAVLVSNNVPGVFNGTLGAPLPDPRPVVGISLEDGNFIRAQAVPIMMAWTDQMTSTPSPTGGLISSFSSYGPAPDLALKPDIGAPGGNIYSTYPLELGGYATLSGTSMSSPHVAGAAALYLQAHPRTPAQAMRSILPNTALPKAWWGNPALGYMDNVHRQGAGMLQIDNAILATTSIEPAKLSIGESEFGPATRTLTIKNSGPDEVTYDLSHVPALSTGPNTFTPAFLTGFASVAFSVPAVVVPAGGVATVDVTITANPGLAAKSLYGGYVVFTPAGGGQEYRVPYAGFKGDYQAIQVLVPTSSNFPWVARNVSCSYDRYVDGECIGGGSYSKYVEGSSFTLTGTDFPYFAIHFDHPSRLMRVEIYDMNGKPWHRAVQDEYLPRNSTATGFYVFFWSGKTTAGNKVYTVPDGTYYAKISVLKALGDSSNPAHWETWTSPMFVIDRP